LAFNITGHANTGITCSDGNDTGTWLFNRLLMWGDGDTYNGIRLDSASLNDLILTNSIFYGIGGTGSESGIRIYNTLGGHSKKVYNNTCISNYTGINAIGTYNSGTLEIKNNLCNANSNADWVDNGAIADVDTVTAKNVSEDSTSPDAAYRNATVTFVDSANDDFRLHVDDTAAKNQGEDLSATFADDIQGQSRSLSTAGASWDIGADENIVSEVQIGPY